MKQHELRAPRGAVKARKRVGRGAGSGHGKTAGRGMSGQLSRSNIGLRPTFEGGQRPITQRMPTKRGFHNPFRTEYTAVNVARLAEVFTAGATVTPESLYELRVVRNLNQPIKILGQGELATALNIHAHAFSEAARAKIIAAGGTCTILDPQVLEAATGEAPSESA